MYQGFARRRKGRKKGVQLKFPLRKLMENIDSCPFYEFNIFLIKERGITCLKIKRKD